MTLHVGVTATRNPLTEEQRETFRGEVLRLRHEHPINPTLHHGCCVNGDAIAHEIAWVRGYSVIAHPPTDPKLRAWVEKSMYWDWDTDTLLPEKPYLERNLDIVKAVGLLIVIPDGPYRIRSGTWWSWSAAKREGVPTLIIQPDGSIA